MITNFRESVVQGVLVQSESSRRLAKALRESSASITLHTDFADGIAGLYKRHTLFPIKLSSRYGSRATSSAPSEILTLSSDIPVAYQNILRLERSGDQKDVMYARILGYLLLYGPKDEARKIVAEEVVSCANEDQLAKRGKYYCDYYIRACKFSFIPCWLPF